MYGIPCLRRVVSLALFVLGGTHAVGLCQDCTQETERWSQGPADAVFTASGQSYFGSGTHLMVGDASDINAPQVMGWVDLGMLIGDIVVIDDTAHVAAGNFNEQSGAYFEVDVSDPAAPVVSRTFATPGPARSVWVAGTRAYVGVADVTDEANGSLLVLDLRPPGDPTEVVDLQLHGWPEEIAVDGDLLWVTELGRGVRAINVAGPALPFEVAAIEGNIRDADADDGVLYLVEWGDDRDDAMVLLDVVDPAAPVELGRYDATRPRQVEIFGPAAYLLSSPAEASFRLEVIDITQPDDPDRSGILSVGSPGGDLLIQDLMVAARIAYVTTSQAGPILVDTLDFENPRRAGSFLTPGVTSSLDVSDDLVVVAGGSSGLVFLERDLTPIIRPPWMPRLEMPFAQDVALAGDTAFVAAWQDGVWIYDVSNPLSPVELASIDTGYRFFRVVVSDDILYASFYGDLYVTTDVYSVTDPANPEFVGEIQGGVMAVAHGYAYADWSDWLGQCALATWDVSDPSAPGNEPTNINFWGGCRQCDWPWPGYTKSYEKDPHRAISGIAIWQDQGWVAVGSAGLTALDLTDPSAPRQVGTVDIDACGMAGVAARDGTAWVATSLPSGLLAVRLTDDGDPVVTGFQPLAGFPADAAVSGGTVFTANQTAGVSAVEGGVCRAPLRPSGRRTP